MALDRTRVPGSRLEPASADGVGTPGKRTLTQRLQRSPSPDAIAASMITQLGLAGIQRKEDVAATLDGDEALAVAASGFAGAGSAPPQLETIQRSFGRHDVSDVRAHVGGAAAEASRELGARAYASGDQVAFAEQPDTFLIAHELAHVVQQRGGVQLAGGVGAAGDEHERHADEVAAAVVRGDSAEPLLDRYAGGGGAPVRRAVQLWADTSELGVSEREMIRVEIDIAIERNSVRDIIRGLRRARRARPEADDAGAAHGLVEVHWPPWHLHTIHPDDIDPLIAEAQERLDNWNREPAAAAEPAAEPAANDEQPATGGEEPEAPAPAPAEEPRRETAPAQEPATEAAQGERGERIAARGLAEVMLFRTPQKIDFGRYGKVDVEVRVQHHADRDLQEGGADGQRDPTRISAQTRIAGPGQRSRQAVVYEQGSDPIARLNEYCELDFHQAIEVNHEPRTGDRGGGQFNYSTRFATTHFNDFHADLRINLVRNERGKLTPEAPSFQMTCYHPIEIDGTTLRPRFDFILYPNWVEWGRMLSRACEGVVEAGGRAYRGGVEIARDAVRAGRRALQGGGEAAERATQEVAEEGGERVAQEVAEEGGERVAAEVAEEGTERASREGAELLAREAAEQGAEGAARVGLRGALGTAAHVAGALVEPIMVLIDFYICMEHIASIIPGIQADAIQHSKVNDFADLVSSWVYGGRNQHEARVAMIDDRASQPRASNGEDDFLRDWRAALRAARREAHTAFADLRQRDQISALRQQHPTQRELYHALGEQTARRQGVSFSPDDVERFADGSVHRGTETMVSANERDARSDRASRRRHAERGAREDDPEILDHLTVVGERVVIDDRMFWLAAGIEVKIISAHRDGEAADDQPRWRVGLEITDAMPGVDTVESGEGPIENRVGSIFTLTAVGSPRSQ